MKENCKLLSNFEIKDDENVIILMVLNKKSLTFVILRFVSGFERHQKRRADQYEAGVSMQNGEIGTATEFEKIVYNF